VTFLTLYEPYSLLTPATEPVLTSANIATSLYHEQVYPNVYLLGENDMAQLTLYLDQETVSRMRQAAESEGLSQSQWVARLIRARLETQWPQAVRELAGAWTEFPEVDELRRSMGDDLPRESL
jgi:hypothetical protein